MSAERAWPIGMSKIVAMQKSRAIHRKKTWQVQAIFETESCFHGL
jgi:hypothetical protein